MFRKHKKHNYKLNGENHIFLANSFKFGGEPQLGNHTVKFSIYPHIVGQVVWEKVCAINGAIYLLFHLMLFIYIEKIHFKRSYRMC